MNLELVGTLVRLRYKLMWAKVRSRNGKIALFVVGYLALMLLLGLVGAGGFGAGAAAVRSGKGELVAQLVLSALYFQATLSTVLLGFGVNAVFSETELRRYPLVARERWVARHAIGILDPFWLIVVVLDLGLLFGLYLFGNVSFGLGLAGVLLLFLSNYLLARAIAAGAERLTKGKTGSLVLVLVISCVGFLPGTLIPLLDKHREFGPALLRMLWFTPSGAAAAAMAGNPSSALYGLALLVWWVLGFLAALVWLERLSPARKRAVAVGPIEWEGPCERLGALFGAQDAPLVALWLRFYARNTRFRTLCLLTFPLVAFLIFNMGQSRHMRANAILLASLGAFPVASFMGTSRIAVNLYGYTGGAVRRYFLLPTDPAASLRTGSYASLLLGGGMLLLATLGWAVLAPVHWDARILFLLVTCGITGLFGFHGAGLWTTLYSPRRGNYGASFGNDMSVAGNVLFIGGMVGALVVPQVLSAVMPGVVGPESWWVGIPLVLAALAFYLISLRLTCGQLSGRRETLVAVVEGKA